MIFRAPQDKVYQNDIKIIIPTIIDKIDRNKLLDTPKDIPAKGIARSRVNGVNIISKAFGSGQSLI